MIAARALLVAALLAVCVIAGAGMFADFGKLQIAFEQFSLQRIGMACTLVVGNSALRIVRFRYYLGRLEITVSWTEAALVFIAGFLFTVTPGQKGEVVKGLILKKRRGASATVVASSVVAERFTDVVGLLLVAALGVWQHGAYRELFWGVCGLCGLFLASVVHPRLVPSTVAWAERRLPHTKLVRVFASVTRAHEVLRKLCSVKSLAIGVSLAAAAWLLEAVAFRVLLDGLGAAGEFGPAVVVYAMATLFGAVSMLPGGVGSTEAVMVALLITPAFGFNLDRAGAVLATLLIRLCTLWFGVGLGALAWLLLFRGRLSVDSDKPTS